MKHALKPGGNLCFNYHVWNREMMSVLCSPACWQHNSGGVHVTCMAAFLWQGIWICFSISKKIKAFAECWKKKKNKHGWNLLIRMFYCLNHPILQKAVGSEVRTKQEVAYQMKDESSETLPKGFFSSLLSLRFWKFVLFHLMLIWFGY